MVVVITRRPLDGCAYLLQPSGWLMSFPGDFWMGNVISWGLLDGCYYFLEPSGYLLLFPGGFFHTLLGPLSNVLER